MSSEKGKGRGQVTSYCDWMSQLPDELHKIPLFNLAIPGMKLKQYANSYSATAFNLYTVLFPVFIT